MPFPLLPALMMGGGLLGKLFNKKPEYGMDAAKIDQMIQAVRGQGMEGLRSMGQREQEGAAARLGASGMAMTPAMQQAAFAPVFNALSGARTNLEGQLGRLKGGMQQHSADQQFQGDMAGWQDLNNLFGGIMDIGGLGMLGGGFGAGGSGMNPKQLTAGSPDITSKNWVYDEFI